MGGKGASSNEEFNQACAQISSRGVYGSLYYPIFEGSGGGGSGTIDSGLCIKREI